MSISQKLQQQMLEGGWIRKMFEEGIALKKEYGESNVFDLSLGNPELEPPERFNQEFRRLANSPVRGMHRYMPNAGYPETRAAVAAHLSAVTGLNFTMNEILMTCGAAGAINVVLKTILDAGDEVIIFSPFFAEYVFYIDNHQGIARIVPTDERFMPDLNRLESSFTPKTRAIVINSPNNPTGAVYDHNTLRGISELLQKKEQQYGRQMFLIGDDVYRRLIYDGVECPYLFQYHPRTIVTTSHSKDLSLPGERIGYIAVNPACEGHDELVNGLVFCNRVLGFVNAPALMQNIVRGLQDVSVDVGHYERKRNTLFNGLVEAGYSVVKPAGAFYIFPRSPVEDELAFIKELQKYRVLVVPGRGFGTPGYFRLAYCVGDEVIEGALSGFRAVANDFRLL